MIAALLYARNITKVGLAAFYSVAIKSMSVSWKAFFYGAFDPKATITIDKLAGSFLPQALSARIFGFHPWSLALPQVIEGVISDSWQRAVMDARLRSLIWAGVWVGLGFQAKMLQAWMILPALGIGYLLAAPAGLRRRLWHLGAAGLVMLAASLSLIALYTFTPAAEMSSPTWTCPPWSRSRLMTQ